MCRDAVFLQRTARPHVWLLRLARARAATRAGLAMERRVGKACGGRALRTAPPDGNAGSLVLLDGWAAQAPGAAEYCRGAGESAWDGGGRGGLNFRGQPRRARGLSVYACTSWFFISTLLVALAAPPLAAESLAAKKATRPSAAASGMPRAMPTTAASERPSDEEAAGGGGEGDDGGGGEDDR
mmetsp:Transcript_54298/g.161240  ORF Transcript_54298/g.161240 Transcript_54298/m.161240 type:complete len:183 (+) Transcript_54298:279-827(+)